MWSDKWWWNSRIGDQIKHVNNFMNSSLIGTHELGSSTLRAHNILCRCCFWLIKKFLEHIIRIVVPALLGTILRAPMVRQRPIPSHHRCAGLQARRHRYQSRRQRHHCGRQTRGGSREARRVPS
ncbi:unnamed protein product [Acanthoscelides obtectus]|uniref:Uncharacterized protein n=1 Tax=Acanthoscelides obtectus TaxID=200917 RepID=A0A9P0Q7E8_ACAOB|nr:unnamed protein product [Acanthoscelides obtectus]CAK1630332.1 hypothetical protein AOBTE_LOCUS6265 [Acanthoscelides obtectus]